MQELRKWGTWEFVGPWLFTESGVSCQVLANAAGESTSGIVYVSGDVLHSEHHVGSATDEPDLVDALGCVGCYPVTTCTHY